MGYRAGIGPILGGGRPQTPHIVCDGCGATHGISSRTEYAAKWFRQGKPPRGWRGLRKHDGSKRWDLCPKCWRGE